MNDLSSYEMAHLGSSAISKDRPPAVDIGTVNVLNTNCDLVTCVINTSYFNASDSNTDDYDYDYDVSISSMPLAEVLPVGVVYGLTFLLGITGNVLVIFSIVRYRRMQSVTNIFLTSLATADMLLIVLCVPIKFAKWVTFTWEFGEVLCKGVHYLMNVSVICSVITLTAMSMERYYAIVHPMKAKYMCTGHRARRAILLIWVCSLVLALPIVFGQVHKEVGEKYKAFWCVREWPLPLYNKLYQIGMLLLIFAFPLVIITFAYVNIAIELWVMSSRRQRLQGIHANGSSTYEHRLCYTTRGPHIRMRKKKKKQHDDERTRKQVVKMLVIVIILFVICWGPIVIDNVLAAFGYIEMLNYGSVKYIRQAFSLMSYANSCINPIVYAFMSKTFRQSFKAALLTCLPGRSSRAYQRPLLRRSHLGRSHLGRSSLGRQSLARDRTHTTDNLELKHRQSREWTAYTLIPMDAKGSTQKLEMEL